MLKKSVPASIALHNIACNYKLWKIRHTERQTSFFSNYFFRAKCATCSFAFNASKRNLLLSGDVELNPGPVAKGKTSSLALVSNTTGDLLLNYRLLRHGLRPLMSVEEAIAFLSQYHTIALAIAMSLDPDKAPTLPMFHALTECDTVSFFGERGKKNGLVSEESVSSNDTSAKSPQSITTRDQRGIHGCA